MELPSHSPRYLESHGSLVKSLATGRRETLHPYFKRVERRSLGATDPSASPLLSGQTVERTLLEALLRHMEEREVIQDSQHGFTKGKSCLTNLVAFCDEVTASVDKEELQMSPIQTSVKAFDTAPDNILPSYIGEIQV